MVFIVTNLIVCHDISVNVMMIGMVRTCILAIKKQKTKKEKKNPVESHIHMQSGVKINTITQPMEEVHIDDVLYTTAKW